MLLREKETEKLHNNLLSPFSLPRPLPPFFLRDASAVEEKRKARNNAFVPEGPSAWPKKEREKGERERGL